MSNRTHPSPLSLRTPGVDSPPGRRRKWAIAGSLVAAVGLWGCGDTPTDPGAPELARVDRGLVDDVRRLAAATGLEALNAPRRVRPKLAKLGQALVFDPELSGNRDISCMTCHWPSFGTSDGRSLPAGEGATGLGPDRVHPDGVFIPRNAPPTFNLHAQSAQFWDGRVAVDAAGRFHTPAGNKVTPEMTRVFEFGSISAQGLFPVTSRAEMRGNSGNELAAIPDTDEPAMWRAIMARLGAISEYRRLFEQAYPGTDFEDMNFGHASNAMAGFYLDAFTFVNTPWDEFLRGKDAAMTLDQLDGARAFMAVGCAECHSGAALTDVEFHNTAMPQIGPGKGDGTGGQDDFGRMRVTGDPADIYRFRTPPLRNVELTGPFGHGGPIPDLRDFIAHYSESDVKLRNYDPSVLEPALQGTVLNNADQVLANRDPILDGLVISEADIDRIRAFMSALTDPATRNLERAIPQRVPSGLPVSEGRPGNGRGNR